MTTLHQPQPPPALPASELDRLRALLEDALDANRSLSDEQDALRQVALAVAGGADPESVFALVAERAAFLVGGDGGGVVRFEGRYGRLVGHWTSPQLAASEVPRVLRLDGGSAVAQVHRTGEAGRVDDYSRLDDERARFIATRYRSGVAVPIRLGARVWGAVAVGTARDEPLDAGTESRLNDFAELVALAIANADPMSRRGIASLLDTLLTQAPVGIALFDRQLRFVRVNPALAEINGHRPEEHLGKTLRELDERLPPEIETALERVRDTGEPILDVAVSGETSATPGRLRHWISSYYPVRGDAGAIVGVGAVVVEVTERKQATDELRGERDYSAALIAAMQDGLAVAAPDGTLNDVNPRFCEITGFVRDELVGRRPPYPYWPEEELPTLEAAFARNLAGDTVEHDLVFRRKDGTRFPVIVAHRTLLDAEGRPHGHVVTVKDVTERARAAEERVELLAAEKDSRERTERLQAITAALSGALTPTQVLDVAVAHGAAAARAGRCVLVAAGEGGRLELARTVGLSTERRRRWEARPLAVPAVFHEAGRSGQPLFFGSREELAAHDPKAFEHMSDTSRSFAVLPLPGDAGPLGVMSLSFDDERTFSDRDRALMTTIAWQCAQALERSRLYERTRASAEALGQRDALKTAVLRGVSHEFRSPLTAISNAAVALEHVTDVDERRDLLAVVAGETRRLDRLVANVLDLSRLEAGVLEPRLDWCSVDELAAGALDAAHTLLNGQHVLLEVDDGMPLVRADPVLTERILLNLLHNAIRHGAPPIRLQVRRGADAVEFIVSDHGPGVPPGDADGIFAPFVGRSDRGGMGLGLGLSRGLALAQGGDLSLIGTPIGARFVVTLPVGDPR